MSCVITRDPTGPQTFYLDTGAAYDAIAAAAAGYTDIIASTLVIKQTLGPQVDGCVVDPLPTVVVNDFGINGGILP